MNASTLFRYSHMRWMWTTFLLLLLLLYIYSLESIQSCWCWNDEVLCVPKWWSAIKISTFMYLWQKNKVDSNILIFYRLNQQQRQRQRQQQQKRNIFKFTAHYINIVMEIYFWSVKLLLWYTNQLLSSFAIHCKLCFKILICKLEMNYYVYFVAR